MKTRSCLLTVGLWLLTSPAFAQIIATSIPRTAQTAGAVAVDEKRFALHVMGSPMSKWKYNELAAGALQDSNGSLFDVGLFSGTPNSDFLFAGEAVFKAGRDFSVGVGGWHNKVGKVRYAFAVNTVTPDLFLVDTVVGTLDGDLTLYEGHGNVFYKNVGVQAGLVRTSSALTSSVIRASAFYPEDVGKSLDSIESNNTANDWDLYGVYKYGGDSRHPFGVSAGAGLYAKQGTVDSAQRAAENQTVFSSFVTGSIDIFKGFGFDASYWYIAKTKAVIGNGPTLVSDATSRFTLGFGYSFSK